MSVLTDLKVPGIVHHGHHHSPKDATIRASPSIQSRELERVQDEVSAFSSSLNRQESSNNTPSTVLQEQGDRDGEGLYTTIEKFDDMSKTRVGIILFR